MVLPTTITSRRASVARKAAVWLIAVLFSGSALSAPPRIDRITLAPPNRVFIHFDTDANRKYELQYINSLAGLTNSTGNWSNLYVAPSLPIPDHYIIPDFRTTQQRFYRLRVTP